MDMLSKLVTSILIGLCSIAGTMACASNTSQEQKNETKMNTNEKKLVVFFSHTGENYNVGYIEKGNTHIIADMIADAVNADRFEIVPEKKLSKRQL